MIAAVSLLLIAAAAVAGFVLANSSDSPSEGGAIDPGNAADRKPQTPVTVNGPGTDAASPPCDAEEAEVQLRSGQFADAIRRELGVPRSSSPADEFLPKLVACADLTGDGEDEMVVKGTGPTGGAANPWAIFTPEDGEWSLAAARTAIPVESLTVVGSSVHEVSPTYGADDPLCCPSGSRSGYVRWNGSSFEYVPDQGSSTNRAIHLAADGTAERLGDLELHSANLRDARALFGTPSTVGAEDFTACRAGWNDLGLGILFEDFSGSGACGPAGRVGSVEIRGGPGAQAGWVVDGGIRIGTPLKEALESYPDAYLEDEASEETCPGSLYVLQTTPAAGTLPSLLIHAQQGEVACIELSVLAAGV